MMERGLVYQTLNDLASYPFANKRFGETGGGDHV
ncbi:Uncharacterised protein [BD1-7 clade bacterium]|uniref:Uncharacterized protein n=1 Tax=BD1-7 clade bacterium TaxID=2029982 RepID=A0A5S9N723_9GAMM|nr:Uncharacterised protein [BD1-7 clade bacterium]